MVRVLIERRLRPGSETDLKHAMREVRGAAVHASGYISGETLQDPDDPCHLFIISTWRSAHDWKNWASSEHRARGMDRIGKLLEEPERVTVLEPV